jgi:hypothetical protein
MQAVASRPSVIAAAAAAALAKPVAEDVKYTVTNFPGGNCGAVIVHSWNPAGYTDPNSTVYHMTGGMGTPKDWSLPLSQDLIDGVKKMFDTIRNMGPTGLVTTTICDTKEARKYRSDAYVDRYPIIEHILSRTGWVRAAKSMGAHGYPIQFWVRPSNGKNLE